MPGLYLKLIGGAIAALVLLGLVLGLKHYKGLAESRGEKLAIICTTTREASDNPKLDCGNVALQIGELGASVKNTKVALERQNTAIKAQAAEINRQKAEAAQASQQAVTRARAAQATSDRLAASSRSGGPPCEPSKALEGAWR
jgi:hypothetical protein